jgi:GNAT superfamily N-acetyltransferase
MIVAIRRAAGSDAGEITEVHLSSRRAVMPHLRRVHTDAETCAYFARMIDNPAWDVMVADHDGFVVGFSARREQTLDHLYVRPGWFRKGIGRQLLGAAKAASPGELELYCFQCNSGARAFYEGGGFTAELFGDGTSNEEGEPDILYRWKS